jgi:hypothetical protein
VLPLGLSVWWKPAEAPDSVLVRIPPRTAPNPGLTIRTLLFTLGIDPRVVAAWYVCGASHDCRQGSNPLLDAPLPPAAFADDQAILVQLDEYHLHSLSVMDNALNAIDRIAADWNTSLQLENQLELARKQMYDAMVRINILNRDLSSDERWFSDRQDQSDWQEARRWLRDIAARLSKLLKECDIGMSSSAGRRNTFEAIYHQVIAPRRPCEGLDGIQREFEAHRKTIQTLLLNMGGAQATATQEVERRAQLVLQRIASKVRQGRTKRA